MKKGDAAPRRDHPVRGRILRIALGITVGLVAAEILVRLFFALVPAPSDSNFILDPQAGYRIRPDAPGSYDPDDDEHYNQLGLRGREVAPEKEPGTIRLLGIGDSFVFGSVAMDHNFLRVAERRVGIALARAAGPNDSSRVTVEVIPMGIPGYSPENYAGILQSIGLSLDPDLVILCFFVGNDVTGIPVKGTVLGGELYYVGSSNRWLNLLRNSRLYIVTEKIVLSRIKRKYRQTEETISTPDTDRSTDSDRAPKIDLTPPYKMFQARRLPIYRAEPDPKIEPLWREAEKQLLEFDRICREAGVPWVLLPIPSEIQVDPEVRQSLLEALSLDETDYKFDAPQDRLENFARQHGIGLLDPLPALRREHRPENRLYIPNDTHWSVRGNRLAGNLLAAWISRYVRGLSERTNPEASEIR